MQIDPVNVILEHLPPAWTGALAALLGLSFGSFAGMCAYRLPRQKGIVRERSHCPGCSAKIPAWRNIPVFSYVLQRGRCFACHRRIHWRYLFCEALCALLVWACWRKFGLTLSLPAGTVLCGLLVLLSAVDLEHRTLPDRLTLPLLWLGLLFSLSTPEAPFASPADAIAGATAGYGLLWLVDALWRRLGKRAAFGGGDLKLLAALGAWLGPCGEFGALAVAAVAGALFSVARTLGTGGDLRDALPFGPFLMMGGVWVLLVQDALLKFTVGPVAWITTF